MTDPHLVLDQWGNAITGLNTVRRDKRSMSNPIPLALEGVEALEIYTSSDTAKNIIEIPVDEGVRAGFDTVIPGDETTAELIDAALDDLCIEPVIRDAWEKQRLFGGAGVLMLVEDGEQDLSRPLNVAKLKRINRLIVFEPDEIRPQWYSGDLTSENFGLPSHYAISPRTLNSVGMLSALLSNVHASRVLRFCAPNVSRLITNQRRGWGTSALDQVWPVVREFDQAFDHAAALVPDFAQAVFKVKGLAASLTSKGADSIKSRLELVDYSRSVLRAIALDADGEDFERKATPISGLPELLDRFCNRLSAACRIPVTKLMGQAPAGLNSTGDADERNFHAFVASQLQKIIMPPMRQLVQLVMLSKEGPTKGKEPENWAYVARPMVSQSDADKAALHFQQAQADQIYLANGVVDAGEIRAARFEGDGYSTDTHVSDEFDRDDVDDLAASEGVTREDPQGNTQQVMPGKTGANLQATALNGAQVSSALEIVTAYNVGTIERTSAIAMLMNFFQLQESAATAIVGERVEKQAPAPVAEAAK